MQAPSCAGKTAVVLCLRNRLGPAPLPPPPPPPPGGMLAPCYTQAGSCLFTSTSPAVHISSWRAMRLLPASFVMRWLELGSPAIWS